MNVKITDNTDKAKKEMQEKIIAALSAVGLQAEGDSKIELENPPRRIDTGRLRNSITHELGKEDEKVVYIGTNVEYAIYVHEGTKSMEPNRFLRNAIEKNKELYKSIIERYLKEK